MHRTRQTAIFAFTFVFLAGTVVSLQAADAPVTLEYIMNNRTISVTVQSSQSRYEMAQVSAARAGVGSEPDFTITPTTKLSGGEGTPDPNKATLTASLGLTVPLGLTEDQRTRATTALEGVETAAAALAETELSDIREIVQLYHASYLAQREREVGELELEAARSQLESERARFERGELRFSDFVRSENEFADAEADLSAASAAWREAVLNLSVATGLDLSRVRSFEAPPLMYQDSTLLEDAHGSSADSYLDSNLLSRYFAVQESEREAALDPSFLSLTQVRASLDYLDHAASASFSPTSRLLGLSYTPEGVVLWDDTANSSTGSSGTGSSDSDPDWLLSISLSLALAPSQAERYEYQTAGLAVEQSRLALVNAELQAAEERRESELELSQASAALQSLVAAVERAEINLAIVRARELAQQVRPADVRAAEAALERSLLNVERAELLLDQKYLDRVVPSSDALRILRSPATWRTE